MLEVALTKVTKGSCKHNYSQLHKIQHETKFRANLYSVYMPQPHKTSEPRTSLSSCKYHLEPNPTSFTWLNLRNL